MREEDTKRLAETYDDYVADESFADAIGASVPSSRDLEQAVLVDLDDEVYGVGWWAPHPGTKRRIFISDHLMICARSVEINTVEAKLHYLEARGAFQHLASSVRDRVRAGADGKLHFEHGPQSCPLQELPLPLARLHTAGVFRAVGSVMDCLAACAIGVLAIPLDIRKADIGRLRDWLSKLRGTDEGSQLQREFSTWFEKQVDDLGPANWLTWANQYRNMLVHRARRLELNALVPRNSGLVGQKGEPLAITNSIPHLLADPDRSDVETLLDWPRPPCLQEDGERTLARLVESSVALAQKTCERLVELWTARRENPALLVQPEKQWPLDRNHASGFDGFFPGTEPYNPSEMYMSPKNVRRLTAATLDNASRDEWSNFD